MTTETATNQGADDAAARDTSATGVADPGTSAQTDDIDTEDLDRMPAPDEDDEADAQTGEGDADASGKDKLAATKDDPEEVEVDLDGKKLKVSKDVAPYLMRQADYTQKTQEVADQRRALETERSTWEAQQVESRAALPAEYEKVAVLSHGIQAAQDGLKQFEQVDWPAFRAMALADPDGEAAANYRQYRTAYDAARDHLADLQGNLTTAKTELTTKEQARLDGQRTEAQQATAKAWEETGAVLKAQIPGWSEARATELAKFAVTEVGVTPDELQIMTDPRLWKLLNSVHTERERATKAEAALKNQTTATNHEKAQATAPAAKTGGATAPARVRDDVGTDTWMARRNAQLAAKAKR